MTLPSASALPNLPILHFVHANSYPSATYGILFRHLAAHYDVQSLPLHAHDPRYPVRSGWHHLVDELLDTLQARYTQPVILVGHSMGGMLSMMAAKARPDLVRCVLLLDAPVIAGWRALMVRVGKAIGLDRRYGPALAAQNRRNLWPDRAAALAHYADKPIFASWAPGVLEAYLEGGLAPHPEGVTLRFQRDVEAAVYRSLPHHLGRLARRFPVPIGFIGGDRSIETRLAGLHATRRLVGSHFRLLPGGHLFPMESPAATAVAIHQMLTTLTDR